jgi:hypothetical protein
MTSEEITNSMLSQAEVLLEDGKLERARDLIEAALNRIRTDHNKIKSHTWNKPTPTR